MSTDNKLYLFQYKDGYRFNSDSLILYDFISKFNIKGKVLDIGSGCGILGLLLKRNFPAIDLTQVDVQTSHVFLNKKSAAKNHLETEILELDITEANFEKKFDIVLSNPPFYNEGSQKSKNIALKISRYANTLPFDELCKSVSSLIAPRGSFIFCYDAKQIDMLLATLLNFKFKVNDIRFVHTKKTKDASLVLIHAKKSSKSLCKIVSPLFMDSSEMNEIYNKTQTQSQLCQHC